MQIYCDNLFTSLDLLDHLGEKGIGVTGTVRAVRLYDIPLPNKKKATKELQRGEFRAAYTGGSTLVVWRDNQPVYMASNFEGVEPVGEVTRFCGQQKKYIHIPQPHLNLSYNSNMGGVDLLDNGEKNHAITTRIHKWYWSVYSWFLNISMVQSWRLYREHMKERSRLLQLQQEEDIIKLRERMVELGYDKSDITRDIKEQERQQKAIRPEEKKKEEMPLLEFTRQVVELTMQEHGKNGVKTVRSRTCSRTVQATVRFDNGRHLIYLPSPIISGVCQNCRKRAQYRCDRCDVALHPNCFREYHLPAKE